jgi:hypothetical protein
MNDQAESGLENVEDIGVAVREGRPVRAARSYHIEISDESLNFRSVILSDPMPSGRQILSEAGLDPSDGYSLFAILQTGDIEDLLLEEQFDLRERRAARFITFRTDREFKLTLNDDQLKWGKAVISGAALHKLSNAPGDHAVYLVASGGERRLIEPHELVDLSAPGIERFITGPKRPLTFEIIVNSRQKHVTEHDVTFEQVVALAFPGSHQANVIFSMTFRDAASKPHSGELGPAGVVRVKKEGTIFNVTRTVQS